MAVAVALIYQAEVTLTRENLPSKRSWKISVHIARFSSIKKKVSMIFLRHEGYFVIDNELWAICGAGALPFVG
jgi:hypothetical protein